MLETSSKQCVAMLLAGGQGSRLYALTDKIAKPAVTFGGKYRIIDFALSNCINSRVDTVGVLTQYQPLLLNAYIGNGQPWDLDRLHGGVHILPPYQKSKKSDWYTGTANAVYQNLNFLERYNPQYVLVLSGDHIYKMDYSKMLDYHKEKEADVSIAVIEVPINEASRFGILNTNDDNSVYEFDEKPKNPKNNMASMGVYIFNYETLRDHLIQDEQNPNSSNDFGKDVIPGMLDAGMQIYAYQFEGYWKDVGTISSLWEANMDFLNNPAMLTSGSWKIYSRSQVKTPQFIGANAQMRNCMVADGCEIYGTVENSLISSGVRIEEGAVVRDSVIMAHAHIGRDATVNYAILDENVEVIPGKMVGAPSDIAAEITVVPRDTVVGSDDHQADVSVLQDA